LSFSQALIQLQKLDEAVQEYRAVLRIAPEMVVANVSLGQLLAMLRRPGDAAACYEQALKYEPGNVAAHENLLIVLSNG
jgi:tetratricopeptide (TPR) repeat protein